MKTIMFDKNATYWENDIDDNLCFVRMRGRYISDLLTVRGYLYMNQIYEHFGIKWNPEDLNELFLQTTDRSISSLNMSAETTF